jgi:hypothetical protein
LKSTGRTNAGFVFGNVAMILGFGAIVLRSASNDGELTEQLSDWLLRGGVFAALFGAVFVIMSLATAGANKRNHLLEARPEVARAVNVSRTAGTVQGLRALNANNSGIPYALPQYFSLALHDDGVGFWDGSARNARSLGHIPWSLIRGVQFGSVAEGFTSFPGIVFDVAGAHASESVVSLPLVVRGGVGGIGAATIDAASRLAAVAEGLRSGSSATT